jgi:hypothetical protein
VYGRKNLEKIMPKFENRSRDELVKQTLSKKQKFALAGLTVFGILLVSFWAIDLNDRIRAPLLPKVADNNQSAQNSLTDEEKIKNQDTDGDGLSDWNELNIYHTSPYLSDSDSDGISDSAEIKNNTDPNCPQGKVCNITAFTAPAAATSTAINLTSATSTLSAASSTQVEEYSKIISCQDMKLLRKYLLDSGKIDSVSLGKISDAELKQMCQAQAASSTKNVISQ